MLTISFWKQAAERAVKSAAQGLIFVAGAGKFDVLTFDWKSALGGVLGMAVLSLLTSIVTSGIGPAGSPSAVSVTAPTPDLSAS